MQPIIDESIFNDNHGVPRIQMSLALKGTRVVCLSLDGACSKWD